MTVLINCFADDEYQHDKDPLQRTIYFQRVIMPRTVATLTATQLQQVIKDRVYSAVDSTIDNLISEYAE